VAIRNYALQPKKATPHYFERGEEETNTLLHHNEAIEMKRIRVKNVRAKVLNKKIAPQSTLKRPKANLSNLYFRSSNSTKIIVTR